MAVSKRAWFWCIVGLLAINAYGLRFAFDNKLMWSEKENHDTRVLYRHILRFNDPLRWLTGDWPLENGFYRPIPSLSFEVDVRLWGDDFPNYKLFNWAVATICALLVLWLVCEAALLAGGPSPPVLGLGASAVFSVWQTGLIDLLPIDEICQWSALAIAAVYLLAFRAAPGRPLLAAAALLYYLPFELAPQSLVGDISGVDFSYRAMGWPPGRTATLFAFSALLALAAYLSAERSGSRPLFAIATGAAIVAFGCYEQAVVLPACLLGCAILLRLSGKKPHWAWQLAPWLALALYLGFHLILLRTDTDYQRVHSARLLAGSLNLGEWFYPSMPFTLAAYFSINTEYGMVWLLVTPFWSGLTAAVANIVANAALQVYWKLAAFGILLSAGAAAPMAFQKRLLHYYYFPAALRALVPVLIVVLIWQMLSAVSQKHLPGDANLQPSSTRYGD